MIVNVYRPSESEPPKSTEPPVNVSVTAVPDGSTAADNVAALVVIWLTSENAAAGLSVKLTGESKASFSDVTIERCREPSLIWIFESLMGGLGEWKRWP